MIWGKQGQDKTQQTLHSKYLFIGIIIMYYIFLFAFKKVFGPIEIVFRYELYMKKALLRNKNMFGSKH